MPFYMYRRQDNRYIRIILPGRADYPISLAGNEGPLCSAIRRATSVPEWELTEESLLAFYRVDPRQFAIIIDLKPRMQDPVSLYQLKHVWGYSANEWTPLALEFEGLYVEERLPPAETQQEFTMPLERTPPIYEFLYVNADAFKGTCTFGKVGYVNGTLLFEPAFHSLVSRINHKRQTVDRLPPIGCT